MPVPATTGQLRTRIEDMQIGDYIVQTFHEGHNMGSLGMTLNKPELPVNGVQFLNNQHRNYFYYLVKVDKGLLVADRIMIHTVSWDQLNGWRQVQGIPIPVVDIEGKVKTFIYRSLTGGVAYADEHGNMYLTDRGHGAFPTNNEWDKYIVNFPQELIQEGKTLADVFHHDVVRTWTQDTPIRSIATSTNRVARGGTTGTNNFSYLSSSTANTTVGFRPVFEYQE